MQEWRDAGVSTVLCLLTGDEVSDLDLTGESRSARASGMKFLSLPIPDRRVPSSPSQVAPAMDELYADLLAGNNVVVHCRQGVGRSGMMAACLLVLSGMHPASAVAGVELGRGTTVPETPEQRDWIDLFASNLANAK